MRFEWPLVLMLSLPAASTGAEPPVQPAPIQRQQMNDWEAEIGYVAITRVGDTLYLSGIACSGADMKAAVSQCYRTAEKLLAKYGASTERIVKETVYTTDIEALKKCIPDRKTFFKDSKYPAATWVEVRRLFEPAHLLEVDLIAQL
jgi:2-iminobutanoate/2-iminopropanoate deaminase